MALAYLEFEDADEQQHTFKFDIGKNRYYAVAVGEDGVVRRNGLRFLQDPVYQSDLLGPLPEGRLGRGRLTIPNQAFNRKQRFVQLMSFRTRDRRGPALSPVTEVPVGSSAGIEDLPPLTFGQTHDGVAAEVLNRHIPTVAMSVRKRPREHSQAMFLGTLMNMLPSILPAVGPLLGNLVSGITGGGGNARQVVSRTGQDAGNAVRQLLGNPATATQIANLIQQIAGIAGRTTTGTATPQRAAMAPTSTAPADTAQSLSMRDRVSLAYDVPTVPPYSQAQIAPALLAALPALAPLLQQVLNPQTIQAVLSHPERMTGTVINGLKDFARLGIESHEQDLRHLRELNPGVDDPALDQLLASLSMNVRESRRRELSFKRVPTVQLEFAQLAALPVYGQLKTLYAHGQALSFPVTLKSPRPIRRGMIECVVKNAEDLSIIALTRKRIENADSGSLSVIPSLPAEKAAELDPGKDYIVGVSLIWKNKEGKKRGTSIQQTITPVRQYLFDRLDGGGETIPLNDVMRYREYWHKIWQSRFADDIKRFEFSCRYFYLLEPNAATNTRMQTRIKVDVTEERKIKGRLRAGMNLSLVDLNRLIPRLAGGNPPLTPEELEAISTPDFTERLSLSARYHAKFRGRDGDHGSLWVYPEFQMQRITLKKAATVNSNGNVTGLTDHQVMFPVPVLVHFIGTRTA